MRRFHEGLFWALVEKTETCWLWQGYTAKGYGRLRVEGHRIQAHRYAYEILVGSIPVGYCLDHLCRVRSCVNPSHLEIVTKKTHCPQGHEYTALNVRLYRGRRYCRECGRIRALARYYAVTKTRRQAVQMHSTATPDATQEAMI